MRKPLTLALVVWACTSPLQARENLLLANFEGDSYGAWTVTGEAFGTGPARGTLTGQMDVSGYEGSGLVNSFRGGDSAKGALTSPVFVIERQYISFLIGGGMHPGEACMNLLVDGNVVRTATGPNDRPGGTEALEAAAWDVTDLIGRNAVIQIVDQKQGGWGHINVDHILQTDEKPEILSRGNFSRKLTVQKQYLIIPIRTGARKCKLELEVSGQAVRQYSTEIAEDANAVDFYAFFNLEPYRGQDALVRASHAPEKGFAMIVQSDRIPGDPTFYTEALRPQLRFSQKVGWNNDTNGMVYYDGEWHVYLQGHLPGFYECPELFELPVDSDSGNTRLVVRH